MRESGMSNQEIADSLGCSYQTVLRLIGPQPKGFKRERLVPVAASQPKPEKPVPITQNDDILPAALVVAERTIVLQGEVGRYEIDTYNSRVHIQIPEQGRFTIPLADLSIMSREISAILRNEDKTKFGAEAW